MEPVYMDIDDTQQLAADPLPFARSYQLEALEKALEQNTVLFLETGSGKTLVAIMLLRSYAYLIRKPSPSIAVFLVPRVVLVQQQAKAVEMHTDLVVGKYWGEMGVDFWDAATWKEHLEKHEVLVMTPQILLNGLKHCFFKLDLIKVLIFDECHHARGNHPYACILTEFYHRQLSCGNFNLPRIFGMTASPIKSKGANSEQAYWQEICELENMMHSKIGALTDYLVPDIVMEEAVAQEIGKVPYDDEHPLYFPPELVSQGSKESKGTYYCYLIELNENFDSDIPVCNIILVMGSELESDISSLDFDLEVDRGLVTMKLKYIGELDLTPELVLICRKFLIALAKVLMYDNVNELEEIINGLQLRKDHEIDYFLLPSMGSCQKPAIDWNSVVSVLFSYENAWEDHVKCPLKESARIMWTKNGQLCKCMLENSLVSTPHNGKVYCIRAVFDHLDGRSLLKLKNGDYITYKEYYKNKHNIDLIFDQELLLSGRHIFSLQNHLHGCRQHKGKDSQNAFVELPPELCCIKMSPISLSTFYSFTFVPSIMHRLESLLIAVNLKKMLSDHCMQNVYIPTMKVLEAITTKKCQEKFHLESLETLGDSFLKYAASQQLFKTYQSHHEGLLSIKKDKLISNATLCKLGCDCKLPGFIRNESFDPKNWMIPGDTSGSYSLSLEFLSNTRSIYSTGRRKLKRKIIADVVEALIGAYLSAGGEIAALLFLNWLGIKVDFFNTPYEPQFKVNPEKYINIHGLESLLNYSFKNHYLLLEALTHGSYMLPEIPRCYQRLEFLGDSVLDYLITVHLYEKYLGLSPGLLTDMRSASVNNDCYAISAVRKGLHKHILHLSQKLHQDIVVTVKNLENYSSESTFGWESEVSFPKVLGDVIESLAGAIFVDSGYNKEVVFQSIRPLLEPLVTPDTLKLHPVRELNELCQVQHFEKRKAVSSRINGTPSVTVEVEAHGLTFKHTSSAADEKTAKKLASKEVLKALKDRFNI